MLQELAIKEKKKLKIHFHPLIYVLVQFLFLNSLMYCFQSLNIHTLHFSS